MRTNLLKIDLNHPDVAKDLLSWGPWVLQVRLPNDESGLGLFPETKNPQTTGGNGFRLDAIKHMDRDFLQQFVRSRKRSVKQTHIAIIPTYPRSNMRVETLADLDCLWSLNTGPQSRFTTSRSPTTFTGFLGRLASTGSCPGSTHTTAWYVVLALPLNGPVY